MSAQLHISCFSGIIAQKYFQFRGRINQIVNKWYRAVPELFSELSRFSAKLHARTHAHTCYFSDQDSYQVVHSCARTPFRINSSVLSCTLTHPCYFSGIIAQSHLQFSGK